MSKYIVDSSLMTGIADNIRLKTGEEGNLVFPTGFNVAIESLPSIEDMRNIKDKVDDIKDIFDSNESEIDKTITTPVDIASFNDGADGLPMALKVAVEPVQDLHGYDHPWPAGGGKNLFPLTVSRIKSLNTGGTWSDNVYTVNNVTITLYTDDGSTVTGIKVNGTASAQVQFNLESSWQLSAGSYILNGCSGGSSTTYLIEMAKQGGNISAANGDKSFTLDETYTFPTVYIIVRNAINVSNVMFYPMIRLSTVTDATFAPYSNICPITGWTGAKATRTGKNLCPKFDSDSVEGVTYTVDSDGTIRTSGTTTGNSKIEKSFKLNAGTYIFSGAMSSSSELGKYDMSLTIDGVVVARSYNGLSVASSMFTITTKKTVLVTCRIAPSSGISASGVVFKPMIRESTESSVYEPFGQVYEVSFPSEAGTVYGGTLTLNQDGTGSLVVDHADVDLGTLTWQYKSPGEYFYTTANIGHKQNGNCICEMFTFVSVIAGTDYSIRLGGAESIQIKDSAFSSTSDFKTAMNGVKVVYELATPVTYTLTAPQVKTLLGLNNVWADTGKINEVEYSADSQLCITNKLNELDSLLSTYTGTQA